MGMEVGAKGEIKAEINVVPLIDIVLVLLIIFMVVTPMLQRGVPVQLPTGRDPDKKPDTREDVIVSVKYVTNEKNELYITGEDDALAEESLDARLKELYERAPSTPLFIKADKRLTYGTVKKVMLQCESAGFKGISLVAEAPQ